MKRESKLEAEDHGLGDLEVALVVLRAERRTGSPLRE